MKKLIFSVLTVMVLVGSQAMAEESHRKERFRMDCRFYDEHPHFCVSSATYKVEEDGDIRDIHYGVSCNRQTIYDDRGIFTPQQTVSDGIRPATSAIPRTELMPQNSLRTEGTYTAKLEVDAGVLLNGVCYVNKVRYSADEQN